MAEGLYLGVVVVAFGLLWAFVQVCEALRKQWLPLNPENLGPIKPDLAFNTATSFTTNTNWQSYVPEITVSYLTNMAGLAVHNFTSTTVGICLAIPLIRGFARRPH